MKIALLAAMDKEMALINNIIDDAHEVEICGMRCIAGKVGANEVLLARCGIGKVNAALVTLRVIEAFHPEIVINSGVAGGAGGVGIGTLLVADRVAYHDVWCGPGTVEGTADGFDRFFLPSAKVLKAAESCSREIHPEFGMIATGDRFISDAAEVRRIRSLYPDAKAVDMESAAIAHTCTSEGVDFAIIRVVSDTPGEGENLAQYKDFWNVAPETTFKALSTILRRI